MASSSGSRLEESLAVILANCRTSPGDVSRLASVNRSCAEVANSDLVWSKLLPPDYKWAVKNAYGGPITYETLKELYDRLCGHVLAEDGLKGYGCDPTNGRMYRTFAARTLTITWGEDERYWLWIQGSRLSGSRFAEVAYLKDVCWLELRGEINTRLVPGTYTLCWVLKFLRTSRERDGGIDNIGSNLRGWETPVIFTFTDGGDVQYSEIEFPPRGGDLEERVQWKDDNWLEYCAGDFRVEEKNSTVRDSMHEVHLKFDMMQTVDSLWKNNLLVDGVVICSKSRW